MKLWSCEARVGSGAVERERCEPKSWLLSFGAVMQGLAVELWSCEARVGAGRVLREWPLSGTTLQYTTLL